MDVNDKCPYCGDGPLEVSEMESTFTDRKFICTQCRKTITTKTGMGKAAQVAPVALGVGAVVGLVLKLLTGRDS